MLGGKTAYEWIPEKQSSQIQRLTPTAFLGFLVSWL